MKRFLERGQEAEQTALHYLEGRGFRCLERNYKCRLGEIDLIMGKGENLYFIEVKGRWTREKGTPLDQVTVRKMQQISRVAMLYLQRNHLKENQRAYFAVIGIDKSADSEQIHWVPDAFDLSDSSRGAY